MGDKRKFRFVDKSAEIFGKYQFCTRNKKDGMFYADCDFYDGRLSGRLKPGALPAPYQPTRELTEKSRLMYEQSAKILAESFYNPPKEELKDKVEVPKLADRWKLMRPVGTVIVKEKSLWNKVCDFFSGK